MVNLLPIIGVVNVEKSSQFYQNLLSLKSAHGGSEIDILTNSQEKEVLFLHKWGTHDHPSLIAPSSTAGNGLILYFKVSDFEDCWTRWQKLNLKLDFAPRKNPNAGIREFAFWDHDGYYVMISEIW